jgi:SAM-dependent methyltransferase
MLTNILRTNFSFGRRRASGLARALTDRPIVNEVCFEEPASYVEEMLSFNNMMWDGYVEALKMANLPANSFGLDAGCGPGGILPLLAEAIGHKGNILGLDYTPKHVEYARDIKAKYLNETYSDLHVEIGTSNFNDNPLRYRDLHGKIAKLDDNIFDWVWSCDTLCPGIFQNPYFIFRELVRVTKPGGKIILFYGNDRIILLPGFQRLESQLYEMIHFPDLDNDGDKLIQTDMANVWMQKEGLDPVGFKTLIVEKHGPVKSHEKNEGHEKPEYNDRKYLDYHLSDMFLSALKDLHNGYNFPIIDKISPNYLLLQSDYYFRLTPQVNIGVVNK